MNERPPCMWFGCQKAAPSSIRTYYPSVDETATEHFCEAHTDAAIAETKADNHVELAECPATNTEGQP